MTLHSSCELFLRNHLMDVVPCMHRILVEHLQNNNEIGKKNWPYLCRKSIQFDGDWFQYIKAHPFPFHKVSGGSSFITANDKVGPHFFSPNYLWYYLCWPRTTHSVLNILPIRNHNKNIGSLSSDSRLLEQVETNYN